MIEDEDFDAPTMKRMLDFMQNGRYEVDLQQSILTSGDDAMPTKLDVLSHLFCYAIAESYQVQELSKSALTGFSDCLRVISPTDFAELMVIVAAHTEAKPVNDALRKVAFSRKDEMASCGKFMKILGCGHLPDILAPGLLLPNEMRAAKQLACHGATLFRLSNRAHSVTAAEHNKLVESHQAALQDIQQLRAQVDKDSSTLSSSEKAHNDAKSALQASELAAKQAKEELAKANERASSARQAMRSMEQELWVLRNAERDRKRNLESAQKDPFPQSPTATDSKGRLSPEGSALQKALAASLEATRVQTVRSQQDVADTQRFHEQYEKTLAELATAVKQRDKAERNQKDAMQHTKKIQIENIALQTSLAKTKQQRDNIAETLKATMNRAEEQKSNHQMLEESNQEVIRLRSRLHDADGHETKAKLDRDRATEEQKTIHQMLEKSNQEVFGLRNRLNEVVAMENKAKLDRDRATDEQTKATRMLVKANHDLVGLQGRHKEVVAENATLHKQIYNNNLKMSEGTKMLQAARQQDGPVMQQAAEVSALRAELNVARLNNFTLQRSVWDLQCLIINNTENMQQLLPYGPPNPAS